MLPRRATRMIVATGIGGLVSLVGVAALSAERGLGSLLGVATLTVLLAVKWALPVLIFRDGDNAELITLDEAFLVVALLLLPPVGVVVAFAVSVVIGGGIMRRPLPRVAFNVGQYTLSASAAVGITHLLAGNAGFGPRQLAAATAGAAAYFLVNSAAVSAIVSAADEVAFRKVWFDGLVIRALVSAGGVAVGLMAVLAQSVHSWALAFAVAPMLVLQLVSQSQVRARRDRQRVEGLLDVALRAHASIGSTRVARVICELAKEHLRCHHARLDRLPPKAGELGARISDTGDAQWLIVWDRRGDEPFDATDQKLLTAIAATTTTALDNASLYEQVQDERTKLSRVVESSSDGIFSVGPDDRVQSWNPAMDRITGFVADDVIGAKWFTVFRVRDADGTDIGPANSPALDPARNGEAIPLQLTTASGDRRWLTCTYSPMAEGGYVVVARDVTAQHEVDELKADFLATVSHELRTPLTPIQGFLRTLLREDREFSPDDVRKFCASMLRQSERLERLVNDLLDATSLQDPDHLFLPQTVDWAVTAARVVDLAARQQPDERISLRVGADVPSVVADEQRAEQVLNNLLGNALKYSPEDAPVEVVVEALGGEVRTSVVDHGPGVAPRDRERIFERFTRLGNHLTRSVGGAGLGLFIARRLVEGMGGRITLDDTPGGGATFTFTLPEWRPLPAVAGSPDEAVVAKPATSVTVTRSDGALR